MECNNTENSADPQCSSSLPRRAAENSNLTCSSTDQDAAFGGNRFYPYNNRSDTQMLRIANDQNISRTSNSYYKPGSPRRTAVSSGNLSNSFFDMLQDYHPAVMKVIGLDQRSPGPAEFLKGNAVHLTSTSKKSGERLSSSQVNLTDGNSKSVESVNEDNVKVARDFKVKNKLQRLLTQTKLKNDDSRSPNLSQRNEETVVQCNNTTQRVPSLHAEEQQRLRIFGHYDCQSMVASMSYARKFRDRMLEKISKDNIIPYTDATPRSSLSSTKCTYEAEQNSCNELLENDSDNCNNSDGPRTVQKTVTANNVSILEPTDNETLWRDRTCPFRIDSYPVETVDHGARYYRWYFYGQKHENWFGVDEHLGPVAISIKREELQEGGKNQQFRLIIRTSDLLTLRGLIVEDSMLSARGAGKTVSFKEVLEHVVPEIQISCLRLGMSTPECEEELLKLDEQALTHKYKVGILYCRSGQCTEEEMYNNEVGGPAFTEFLQTIGRHVRLKGFQQYKGGLDNKTDSTGTHSIYAIYEGCEIMFHVSTMLPFTPNNRQQLLRKRHIGNDIVTIIFQEPGALPFSPANIRSQFQHVFIIVRAVNPCTDKTAYRVAITRSKDVPAFGPPLPAGALFSRNRHFAEYVLAKIVNAENAAHRSEKFSNLLIRTRREYLKELSANFCTNISMDPANKFSIFSSKKREKYKIRYIGGLVQRAAICWQILFCDNGSSNEIPCLLGISIDSFVVIEECSEEVIFATPISSILGWYSSGNFWRLFYHNGECVSFVVSALARTDEKSEIDERLHAVTKGNGIEELVIHRNSVTQQLGFHVQPDGIVTQVEMNGQAWKAGLRQGYRLVEICKLIVATLSHREMIDVLKTSSQLTFVVIKALSDFTLRRGCFNKYCKVNSLNADSGDDQFYRINHRVTQTSGPQTSGPQIRHISPSEQKLHLYKPVPTHGQFAISSSASSSTLSDKSLKELNSPNFNYGQKWDDMLRYADKEYLKRAVKSLDHLTLEESSSLPISFNGPESFSNDTLKSGRSRLNRTPIYNGRSSVRSAEYLNEQSYNDNIKVSNISGPNYDLPLDTFNPFKEADVFRSNAFQPLPLLPSVPPPKIDINKQTVHSFRADPATKCGTGAFRRDSNHVINVGSYDNLTSRSTSTSELRSLENIPVSKARDFKEKFQPCMPRMLETISQMHSTVSRPTSDLCQLNTDDDSEQIEHQMRYIVRLCYLIKMNWIGQLWCKPRPKQ